MHRKVLLAPGEPGAVKVRLVLHGEGALPPVRPMAFPSVPGSGIGAGVPEWFFGSRLLLPVTYPRRRGQRLHGTDTRFGEPRSYPCSPNLYPHTNQSRPETLDQGCDSGSSSAVHPWCIIVGKRSDA